MTNHSPIALLGYGRFGCAFANMLQQQDYSVRVFDPEADVPPELSTATLAEAIQGAKWIILAMPVPFIRQSIEAIRPYLDGSQIVADVGSVKLPPGKAMDELLGKPFPHVGIHPLFGPLSLARGDKPRRVVVCASRHHPQAAAAARALFTSLQCDIIEEDAARHDRAMARTHAMAFFVAKGLIDFGVDDSMDLAPPSLLGMKHMLDAVRGDAGHLFAAIERQNPFAAQARKDLIQALQQIDDQLAKEDVDDDTLTIHQLVSKDK